jgi:CRP-like cAMP-binding protein
MGYIKEYIERLTKLSEQEWQVISSYFVKKEFPKGTKLIKVGDTEQYLSFIEKGIVRYYIPGVDDELTFGFSFDKEFTCAFDSFLTQFPSEYEQEALSKIIVWRISYNDLQKIYMQTQTGNYWGRLIAESLFLSKSKREISLLKYSAKERYLELFTNKTNIIKQIPLKYVASYIGITPQALSRIRRQIC